MNAQGEIDGMWLRDIYAVVEKVFASGGVDNDTQRERESGPNAAGNEYRPGSDEFPCRENRPKQAAITSAIKTDSRCNSDPLAPKFADVPRSSASATGTVNTAGTVPQDSRSEYLGHENKALDSHLTARPSEWGGYAQQDESLDAANVANPQGERLPRVESPTQGVNEFEEPCGCGAIGDHDCSLYDPTGEASYQQGLVIAEGLK